MSAFVFFSIFFLIDFARRKSVGFTAPSLNRDSLTLSNETIAHFYLVQTLAFLWGKNFRRVKLFVWENCRNIIFPRPSFPR